MGFTGTPETSRDLQRTYRHPETSRDLKVLPETSRALSKTSRALKVLPETSRAISKTSRDLQEPLSISRTSWHF